MPLNIFKCNGCGTHRIWGNWDVDKLHEDIPNDRPRNLSPLLRCEGVCDKDQIHTYVTDTVEFSLGGKELMEQSRQQHWISADAYLDLTGQKI